MIKHLPKPLIKNIGFFGDSQLPRKSPVYKDAYEIARLLAEEGYTIVDGGGPGIMDAATKGAEEGGGETIAVTFYPKDAPGFEGRYVGNIVDIEIKTTNYIERMFKLLEHSDAFIIFKGGSGTISEFGTAWVLAKLYYGHHKPFILYGSFWHPIIKVIKEHLLIDKIESSVFRIVEKKENIIPTIKSFEEDLMKIKHDHESNYIEKAFMK
ncbi:MAG: hypothetical protein US60_C0014G0010 [Microgenomates group bacterium GW2011_GWC1_37_8]|uniref:Rossmann fold nucleotide-binding protein n=2 Tax=Candidatus Woeseibacteriota TaxID=1752722 RepID=A0A0G0KXP4_9BACT|nr:MAG: hypothetical protein US60_C0014G0010 [Microgenomates group bacterium GW2011_GWC1_37_8]KKQ84403.1 MAG: hypothetical protein UT08_C0018G0009 [Candidatus Woesebacteria bacterium GW2011_GWB1_38_8]OGM21983.1 MAG: hypothetical protein A2863_03285 [Candidatus Woesebacteria bacterium RIFCSPHIGHO2_01_FULL_38_9b]